MSIEVAVFNAHRRRRAGSARLAEIVRRVLRRERRGSARIAVVLIGESAMARMNRTFLGHRGSTDVISFPLGAGANLEGEIYVNLDRAAGQAREYSVSAASELARLVIHGTLHLAGYDDRSAVKARRMKAKEDRYVEDVMRQVRQQGHHERKSG